MIAKEYQKIILAGHATYLSVVLLVAALQMRLASEA